jgi:cyclophilin family peptidyl-prolyl cis-trans isomerase
MTRTTPHVRLAALTVLVAGSMASGLAVAQSGTAYPAASRHASTVAKRPVTRYAVFKTDFGTIRVQLLSKDAPKTVANFEHLVRAHKYPKTLFFNRSVNKFVVQSGAFYFDSKNQYQQIVDHKTLPNEAGVPNTRGTLAMVKSGRGARSSGNMWFFNVHNNPVLNTENGGYTVFGKITSAAGLKVLSKLAHAKVIDKSSIGPAFKDLPVKHYKGTLGLKNFIYIPKISILTKR